MNDHIADLLSVLPDYNLHLEVDERSPYHNNIQGGKTHISTVLSATDYLRNVTAIKKSNTMFIDQLLSLNGIYMINWFDRKTYVKGKLNKVPK